MPSGVQIYPLIRLFAALALMTIGGTGMYAIVVSLKPVAVEFGSGRGAASLPYTLTMIGYGLGGILMGRISDRVGVLWPALFGSFMLAAGFATASHVETIWQLCLVQGLMIGLLGSAATFAPLVADTSHWFVRRRGIAVAIVISGNYLAGAVWPPIIQRIIDVDGWRGAYQELALFCVIVMPLLALALYRRAPLQHTESAAAGGSSEERPLGMRPNRLQCIVCFAGIGCCVAMAVPQVHIIAYVTDLGFEARDGANMLAIMLGCGVVSRLVSGMISDRIGGLKTLLLGSGLQMLALTLFLPFKSLLALYLIAALFGLSQGGIVPSYTIIVRTFFKAEDAGWRIGMALFFTLLGMAFGGWLAGAIYDITGSYEAAFINAIGFNIANLAVAAYLLNRVRQFSAA
jgi:MFS family permease